MDNSTFLINTDDNIQKEYINLPITISLPSSATYVDTLVTHGLSYIPSARVWYEPSPGKWYPLSLVQMQDGVLLDAIQISGSYSLSTSDLIISLVNLSGSAKDVNVWARVYLDD